MSYKLAWTAISSLLSQYSKEYGPDILLRLNVAYFFPSIPVLMLQTAFNDRWGLAWRSGPELPGLEWFVHVW